MSEACLSIVPSGRYRHRFGYMTTIEPGRVPRRDTVPAASTLFFSNFT